MEPSDRHDPQPDKGKGPPEGKGRPDDTPRPVKPHASAAFVAWLEPKG